MVKNHLKWHLIAFLAELRSYIRRDRLGREKIYNSCNFYISNIIITTPNHWKTSFCLVFTRGCQLWPWITPSRGLTQTSRIATIRGHIINKTSCKNHQNRTARSSCAQITPNSPHTPITPLVWTFHFAWLLRSQTK